jgi:hypothetical protein
VVPPKDGFGHSPNLESFNVLPNTSLNSRPYVSDGEWMMTKEEMLQSQSRNMEIVASPPSKSRMFP